MKNDCIPEAVAVAMINAARDITVAKINAKGADSTVTPTISTGLISQ